MSELEPIMANKMNQVRPGNITNLVVKQIAKPDTEIIARVAALEEETFGRGGLNEWHLPVIVRHGRLYVLVEGEELVGAASLVRDWNAANAYLFDLVVEPAARRRGRGRFLMEKVIAALAAEGVEELELTVAPENEAAVSLYKQLGFKATGTLREEYGKGQDRWSMSLKIARS